MSDYHEPHQELSQEARDLHRALTSLKEEIEAVDWYHQRVECCSDEELAAILTHNRDEEIEHACMTLEWLRRKMPAWDSTLRRYLYSSGSLVSIEDGEEGNEDAGQGEPAHAPKRDLGLGSLKGKIDE